LQQKRALLFGPYKPPPLKVGDRTVCLYRDAEVVVFDWSLAPIPWPLCYHVGTRAFGKGLLVDEELARAVRHESSTAIQFWWGVCEVTVGKWRRALGVGRKDAEGSRRLILQAAEGGLNARPNCTATTVKLWTAEELALLGQLSDIEVARRTGRTRAAVYTRRHHLGIPAARR
jgi:hypothetical protein